MKSRSALFFAALLAASNGYAVEQVEVTTYFDEPSADYREMRVTDSLDVGLDDANPGDISIGTGIFTAAFYGAFNVWNNDIPGRLAASRGGNLIISGNADVQDAFGNSLFYVNAANNRVGMGTNSPQTTLDVRGEVKAMGVFAYQDPLDQTQPYAEMYSQENDTARFTGAYWWNQSFPHKHRYCTTHIDGNPLVIQSIVKGTGYTEEIGGKGRGEFIIMGKQQGYRTIGNKVVFVVGEPYDGQVLDPDPDEPEGDPDGKSDQGDYPTTMPDGTTLRPGSQAYAHGWYQYSSRAYKKDITPLAPAEYGGMLAALQSTDVIQYRLKGESTTTKPSIGFVAEEAPLDMVDESRKSINLGEEAAFLLGTAKALSIEQDEARRRVERLKRS